MSHDGHLKFTAFVVYNDAHTDDMSYQNLIKIRKYISFTYV